MADADSDGFDEKREGAPLPAPPRPPPPILLPQPLVYGVCSASVWLRMRIPPPLATPPAPPMFMPPVLLPPPPPPPLPTPMPLFSIASKNFWHSTLQ